MDAFNNAMDRIINSFYPALRCEIDGKAYYIEKINNQWTWRNEDGDCQEDFTDAVFTDAAECQQDAIRDRTTRLGGVS